MGHISNGEPLTSTEISLVEALNALAVPGAGFAIVKTGPTTFGNVAVGTGTGTVSSVSWVTSQGVSASIANPTSTPAITITLGALTGVTSFNGLVVTANTGVITTGTWNGTTIGVANGGTGNTTFTAYSVILAGTTAQGAFQNVSGLGSSGDVLTSAGAGAPPHWVTPASASASSINRLFALMGA